jgi:uncharacterized membrane protein
MAGTNLKLDLKSVVCAAAGALAIATGAQAQPAFHQIGFLAPGFGPSLAFGVSPDGSTVVGLSNSMDGFQAFDWNELSGIIGIGSFPNDGFRSSQAKAVSNNGVIVGASVRPDSLDEDGSPFVWTQEGGMIFPGNLGGPHTGGEAFGVTADGSIVVGFVFNASGNLQAFRWTSQTGPEGLPMLQGQQLSRALGVSADGSVIVGNASIGSTTFPRPVKWEGRQAMFLPDLTHGTIGSANGVTPDGSLIVGTSGGHAVMWTASGVQDLGTLPNSFPNSSGAAVSADGAVVVGSNVLDISDNSFVAVIWDAQHGMRDLNDVLREDFQLDLGGFFLSFATGVSADGRVICGTGINTDGDQEAWVVNLRAPCAADFDHSGAVNSQDFFDFLAAFFASDPRADFNGNGSVDSQDFFDFLGAFFAGC